MTKELGIGVAIFASLIILGVYDADVATIFVGIPLAIFGLIGVARRRITMRGRVGPYTTYVGLKAIFPSAFFILIGGGLSLLAAFHRWPSLVAYFGG